MKKARADQLLRERALVDSRQQAQALILAGRVFSGERRVEKAGELLLPDAPLEIRGTLHPYVSRGGVKLEGALDELELDVSGLVAADFGASTGGFTDCLLQRGAQKVFAIDVGYGQLHEKLRQDERVVVMERTNARHLQLEDLGERVDLVVIDASFIGLEKLLPATARIATASGRVLAMVKPQFQVGRERVGKGGVVRDPALRQQAVDEVADAATELGFEEVARVDAKIAGPKGNREVFLLLRRRSAA